MWILMASYVLSEMIAFPPILGPGSLYLTYITGNLQNQKIPCALSAMSIAGIEAGSEKANAVSVVAVAVSSITTTVIIALGIVLMQPLTPVLNSAVLAPAFSNVVPAIFGALAGLWLLKEFKVSVVSVVLCLLGILVLKIDLQWVLLGGIALTIIIARFMYKTGIIKHRNAPPGWLNRPGAWHTETAPLQAIKNPSRKGRFFDGKSRNRVSDPGNSGGCGRDLARGCQRKQRDDG